MNFQPSKCENLRVSRKRISPVRSYSLDSTSLKVVSSVKDLGVMVTKDLTWSNHVRYVTAKANRMLGFIRRNCAGIINKDALKLLYISLVRSHLFHCSQVWAPQTLMLMMEVEKAQRHASRFICKNHELSYKDRLTSLNLLPINYWLEYLDILFFFKKRLGYINICIDNYISFCTGSSRHGGYGIFLKNIYAKTSLFTDSFFVRIPNLWDALPSDVKSESNVNVFKNKLKTFYFT